MINPKTTSHLRKLDITVAGISISNYNNSVTHNHIAGSDFYGILYDRSITPYNG